MKFYFTLLLFCLPSLVFGQNRYNILIGVDLSGQRYNYENHSLLKGNSSAGFGNIHATFQYRPFSFLSIETGYQMFDFGNYIIDQSYIDQYPGDKDAFLKSDVYQGVGSLCFDKYYHSVFISLTGYIPINGKNNLYLSGGMHSNFLMGQNSHTSTFSGHENLQFTYNMSKQFYGALAEMGWNRKNIFIGFQYNTAFKNMMEGTYTRELNGNLIHSENISINGNYMGVIFKGGFGFKEVYRLNNKYHLNKKERNE